MIRGGYCQPSIQMWRLMFFLLYHAYLAYAIYFHTVVAQKDQWDWCEGLGFLLIITALFYLGWTLHHVSQCIRRRKRKWLTNWWPLIQSFDRYYRVTGGFFRFTAQSNTFFKMVTLSTIGITTGKNLDTAFISSSCQVWLFSWHWIRRPIEGD